MLRSFVESICRCIYENISLSSLPALIGVSTDIGFVEIDLTLTGIGDS